MKAISAIAADLAAGFGLLTRLPVGWLVPRGAPYRPGRAAWTYPLAGLVVGGAAAAILAGTRWAGLAPLPAAAWTVAGMVLLTGGLHEDGLADTADGFGGGRTRKRRLEIMRDSRIGSYGTLALVLSLSIRIAAIDAMAPAQAGAILLATSALSRAAILPLLLLRPARADGLSQGLGRVPTISLLAGGALAVAAALSLLPAARALEAVAGTLLVVAATASLARRRIGGQTGDVLGAAATMTECLLLSLLAA